MPEKETKPLKCTMWVSNPEGDHEAYSFPVKEGVITEKFVSEVAKLSELFDQKQHDYGSGNIAKFGEVGVLVRVSDKIERLANLQRKGINDPLNEAVEDSWMDIAVYAVIALMIQHNKWEGINRDAPPPIKIETPSVPSTPPPVQVDDGPQFNSGGVQRG